MFDLVWLSNLEIYKTRIVQRTIFQLVAMIEVTKSGTPEQARPARPRSGLDFKIHKVEAT